MVSKNLFASKVEVQAYDYSNEIANKIIEDHEVWWIVQGPAGRLPLEAPTAEAAKARYVEKHYDHDN